MRVNGIIIQKSRKEYYKGVDGENWFLNNENKELYEYFESYIDRSWYDANYVDVCEDWNYIKKYMKIATTKNVEYSLLLCETERQKPHMNFTKINIKFLGYDYAYSGGSYYSVVLNDIVSGRIQEFNDIRLNENGLFNTLSELKEFICQREEIKEMYDTNMFEEGDFIIYKLYKIE